MIEKIKRIFYREMKIKEVNYKTAQKMLKNNSILLDVRSKREYEEGHLEGAISVCLYDLEENIFKIIPNKKTTIIAYCSSGSRSKKAQQILEQLGYENVYNLEGGLENI